MTTITTYKSVIWLYTPTPTYLGFLQISTDNSTCSVRRSDNNGTVGAKFAVTPELLSLLLDLDATRNDCREGDYNLFCSIVDWIGDHLDGYDRDVREWFDVIINVIGESGG